jgi:hypothetical protein
MASGRGSLEVMEHVTCAFGVVIALPRSGLLSMNSPALEPGAIARREVNRRSATSTARSALSSRDALTRLPT